jgi:hypothetical protein
MSGSDDQQQDYVWRFKLTSDHDEALHSDSLTEMVRQELKALLGCVVLTGGGEDLKVTGFRFIGEADADHAVYASVPKRLDAEATLASGRDDEDATARSGQGQV